MQHGINGYIDYSNSIDRFSNFRLESPISLCYQVSTYCNYSCDHCLSSSNLNGNKGLGSKDAIKLIHHIAESGVRRINITGGEPMLRPDLVDLCKSASDVGLEVVVTTNGSVHRKDFVNGVSDAVKLIQVSIDGREELNDRLRHPGSFKRAIKFIEIAKDSGLDVRLNCTIQPENQHEIEYILNLATSLSVECVYFIVMCSQGRASAAFEFEDEFERAINERLRVIASSSMDIKVLDFRRYAHSCVLVTPDGELISQGWSDKDCINTGSVLRDGLRECWQKPNSFDHLLHLVKNVRHPLLYD